MRKSTILGLQKTLRNMMKRMSFPTGHVYDDYESDPWESQEEEPEEQQKGKFISCPEPVNEKPSSEEIILYQLLIRLCLSMIFNLA
jgi:hypothetical protein